MQSLALCYTRIGSGAAAQGPARIVGEGRISGRAGGGRTNMHDSKALRGSLRRMQPGRPDKSPPHLPLSPYPARDYCHRVCVPNRGVGRPQRERPHPNDFDCVRRDHSATLGPHGAPASWGPGPRGRDASRATRVARYTTGHHKPKTGKIWRPRAARLGSSVITPRDREREREGEGIRRGRGRGRGRERESRERARI